MKDFSRRTRRVDSEVCATPKVFLSSFFFLNFCERRTGWPRGIIRTVRWSNFDRLDPKMEVFLQSTEATPCGHVLI